VVGRQMGTRNGRQRQGSVDGRVAAGRWQQVNASKSENLADTVNHTNRVELFDDPGASNRSCGLSALDGGRCHTLQRASAVAAGQSTCTCTQKTHPQEATSRLVTTTY
jgi:hypothetical protein